MKNRGNRTKLNPDSFPYYNINQIQLEKKSSKRKEVNNNSKLSRVPIQRQKTARHIKNIVETSPLNSPVISSAEHA